MRKSARKCLEIFLFIVISFILGSMFTLSVMPIDKTCMLQDSDREYNVMQNEKFRNPELIILILSAPDNLEKRNTIRNTWLKSIPNTNQRSNRYEKFVFKHYFVIGSLGLTATQNQQFIIEQMEFKDILMLPLHDSYKNLTEKVKRSFQYLDDQYDYGLGFKYVLKCDDDSFVNLKNLIPELMNIEKMYISENSERTLEKIEEKNHILSLNVQTDGKIAKNELSLYWGYFSGNARIKTKGKWKQSDWIASDRYIPYAVGGGYLLSKNLISYIAKNAHYLRSFNNEDVSVGFWLAPVNNVLRVHDVRFDTEWTSRGCKNSNLVTHSISPSEMVKLFKNLVNSGLMCLEQTMKRKHYLYDWKVPPSQCCKTGDNVIKLTGN
ncbi:beta-1,3-galactosyltransferase 6 [Leptinotarsa decemlineata]|uniref:beta-1,3-galactosyltransferase 6 n=1 Tax=Leptinotarsa decemlineata TaxID=7539 RepID=UPI000C253762|nr:beta-1,3-galactosyltransferase 6 [Leptinotarsa decemlineata]